YKVKCVMTSYANVVDPALKQTRKVKILKLITNPASKDLTRRGVITKGAILETELGQVRVTSRPGQDGVVNAVLVKR
ncbi:MAG: 30S ribosomal protein S8e, partial [Nitrososphaeria archaeon]